MWIKKHSELINQVLDFERKISKAISRSKLKLGRKDLHA